MNNTSFNSFHDLYSSILHGNEIEFQYRGKHYCVLPRFDGDNIVGINFGEAYSETDVICFSEDDLYNICIDNMTFGKVFSQIDINWRNF